MLKIIKGDLIALAKQGQFDIIIHGCNCHKKMGAGIAAQIREHFPSAFEADRRTTIGDYRKLSNWTSSMVKIGNHKLFIINLYTQFLPGPDFMLSALDLGLFKFRHEFFDAENLKIGLPWIGCGIGGGNQKEVGTVLNKYSEHLDLTVVEYQPPT